METIVKDVTRTFYFGDESIEVTSLARFGVETNKQVPDDDLDQLFINKANSLYRKKHNLIDPIELFEFRKRVGVSTEELAQLLERNAYEIELIENGGFPDEKLNLILKAAIEASENSPIEKLKGTIVKDVTYTLYFGEEPVKVTSPLRFDKDTGEEVPDKTLYEAMTVKAHEIFRKRHNLVSPQEIVEFRKKNNLSIKQLAAMTSIDELWLQILEVGDIPSKEESDKLKAVISHSNYTESYL